MKYLIFVLTSNYFSKFLSLEYLNSYQHMKQCGYGVDKCDYFSFQALLSTVAHCRTIKSFLSPCILLSSHSSSFAKLATYLTSVGGP